MQLSEILRFTRQKAFMSQEEFANALLVSVSTINRWENGKSKPSLSAMKNLKLFCQNNNLPYDSIEREWFGSNIGDSK